MPVVLVVVFVSRDAVLAAGMSRQLDRPMPRWLHEQKRYNIAHCLMGLNNSDRNRTSNATTHARTTPTHRVVCTPHSN